MSFTCALRRVFVAAETSSRRPKQMCCKPGNGLVPLWQILHQVVQKRLFHFGLFLAGSFFVKVPKGCISATRGY